MKRKILLSGLVLFLLGGSLGLVSCGGDDDGNNNQEVVKVVEEKYRGVYTHHSDSGSTIELTIDQMIQKRDGNLLQNDPINTAYTDGVDLYRGNIKWAIFTDDNTFQRDIDGLTIIYKK